METSSFEFRELQLPLEALQKEQLLAHKKNALVESFERFCSQAKLLENQLRVVGEELEVKNSQLTLRLAELDFMTYYLDSIVSNVSQGILFVDLIGNITTYNRIAEKILGIARLNVLFEPFWSVFQDNLLGFSMQQVLKNRCAPLPACISITLPSHEVREVEIEASFILQKFQEGTAFPSSPTLDAMKGLIVLIRDVTEFRRLQFIATRNERLKELGEMASMVAHEIRNPLGGIKGFASLLERDLKDRPEQQQMARYIVEGADLLNRLVTQVLHYTRPLELDTESVDLMLLLHELEEFLHADKALMAKHTLRIESVYEEIKLILDAGLMKTALLNCMINAIQAMVDGGELLIKVFREPKAVVIAIIDSGVGIPPENLEKVFSPFFTTKPEGTGLGLSEVHKVIQAHGGVVEVESELGKGTTFKIRLPVPDPIVAL